MFSSTSVPHIEIYQPFETKHIIINYNYHCSQEAIEEHEAILRILKYYTKQHHSQTIIVIGEGKNNTSNLFDAKGNVHEIDTLCDTIIENKAGKGIVIIMLVCYGAKNGLAEKIDVSLASKLGEEGEVIRSLYATNDEAKTGDILSYYGFSLSESYKDMRKKLCNNAFLYQENYNQVGLYGDQHITNNLQQNNSQLCMNNQINTIEKII